MTPLTFPPRCDTPAKRRAFLVYYAGVLTREADARPNSGCQWMRDGAARALRDAEALDLTPDQRDLFGGAAWLPRPQRNRAWMRREPATA